MGRRARYYYGHSFQTDWEETLREAMWQMKNNLKPAMKHLRQRWKDFKVAEAMGQAGPAPRSESYIEERMAILRMVEAGKLSPEEAARLLDAL